MVDSVVCVFNIGYSNRKNLTLACQLFMKVFVYTIVSDNNNSLGLVLMGVV